MGAHDTLAKDVLEVLLDDLGTFVRECEVPAPAAQRADSYFAPDESALPALHALGLLGRMCLRPCVFDPFSDAPSPDELRESVRKLLNHQHGAKTAAPERLWLPCAGRPDAALRQFGFSPAPEWPRGFYALSEALPVTVVVLPELEDTPDTLALRLMSRNDSLTRAARTLRARTAEVPQGRRLFVAVVKWIHTWRGRGLRWEEDAMLDLTETEAFLERQFAAGMQQGMQQGLAPLLRLFSRRLQRALTDVERAVIIARLDTLGADRLGDVVLDLSAPELAAWLADPTSR